MFGLLAKKKPKVSPKPTGFRIRPCVESLEARDCPSESPMSAPQMITPQMTAPQFTAPHLTAPEITSFNAMVLQGQTVLLGGTVSDADPGSVSVFFCGAANGTTTTDAMGNFQFQTQASALGAIFAVGLDSAGQISVPDQTVINVPAPTFTAFTVTQSGPDRQVTVSGQVSAGAGLTVTLSGIVSASVTTGTDGVFTFTGTASGLGQVNASVTDVWGQTGTSAAQLTNQAPTITNFVGENTGVQNIWDFEGQVTGAWSPGETVTFSGIPALQNVQVTVGADGWFHVQVQMGSTDVGLLVATVTDWYGATGQAELLIES
jgi:hypothetical protein